MHLTAYLKGNTTGSMTSDTLQLAEYANYDGSKDSFVKITWAKKYCDGTLSNILIRHSQDNSSWSTLWSLGDLSTADNPKKFYTFSQYFQVTGDYIVGTNLDSGCRVSFDLDIYGMPNWGKISICRNEDLLAIFPRRLDTSTNFEISYPNQMRAAKTLIETRLKARGIDPLKLYTDGHISIPTVPALRQCGAYLTWWNVGLDSAIVHSEDWVREQEMLWHMFEDSFDMACSSGLLEIDEDGDGDPGDDSGVVRQYILYR